MENFFAGKNYIQLKVVDRDDVFKISGFDTDCKYVFITSKLGMDIYTEDVTFDITEKSISNEENPTIEISYNYFIDLIFKTNYLNILSPKDQINFNQERGLYYCGDLDMYTQNLDSVGVSDTYFIIYICLSCLFLAMSVMISTVYILKSKKILFINSFQNTMPVKKYIPALIITSIIILSLILVGSLQYYINTFINENLFSTLLFIYPNLQTLPLFDNHVTFYFTMFALPFIVISLISLIYCSLLFVTNKIVSKKKRAKS